MRHDRLDSCYWALPTPYCASCVRSRFPASSRRLHGDSDVGTRVIPNCCARATLRCCFMSCTVTLYEEHASLRISTTALSQQIRPAVKTSTILLLIVVLLRSRPLSRDPVRRTILAVSLDFLIPIPTYTVNTVADEIFCTFHHVSLRWNTRMFSTAEPF